MNRTISVQRIYNLGNFQNITLSDTIENIPEELALDSDVMSILRMLQFINLETEYRKYWLLGDHVGRIPEKQSAINELLGQQAEILDKLNQLLKEKEI